ncbi:MAG: carbohydrate kinase family protein [Patescibacteria group bacterium]|nr:carbohydrate kinase family protein [Patescibacteria group bacterium]
MLAKQIDFLAIGDTVIDAFIRLKDAHVNCKVNTSDCELCVRFGDKIPFEYVKVVPAVGNAANAAVAAARLGLRSAFVTNLGEDHNGHDCLASLQRDKVVTSYVKLQKSKPTNYHFVLWYDVDRTILVKHTEFEYSLPKFPAPKWIYLSSLAANTYSYHLEVAEYLEAHPGVKLAFQPGTFQMQLGFGKLKRIYDRTDLFIVNVEEAQRILSVDETAPDARDVKKLMKGLAAHGPKLVAMTDNTNGAYLYDGDHFYHIPMYPDPRPAFERTGCGDAWASTFVSAMAMGKTPLEALLWAPINPMSVAQFIGAQEGLLTLEQLEWWLGRAPADYKPREI